MKILIIFSSKFGTTGITQNVMNYYRHLDKTDLEINFVMINTPDKNYQSLIQTYGGHYYVLAMRNRRPLQYVLQLAKIIRKGQYNIVHAHGNSCTLTLEMLAAKLGGAKIRIVHSRNTKCDHIKSHKLLRPAFDYLYTDAFACGKDAGKWLFRNRDFTIINNGNDIQKYKFNIETRDSYRKMLNIKDEIAVGHVGYFNEQKNHRFLMEVFTELLKLDKRYKLFLIGEGSLKSEIESKVKELGIEDSVSFLGQRDDVPSLLQAMDVMVFPSLFEGFPNVLVEWQIACLPSVISDTITKECKLTDLVYFMSLQDRPATWANKIHLIEKVDREKRTDGIISQIRLAGFDIEQNAKELKSKYIEFMDREYR